MIIVKGLIAIAFIGVTFRYLGLALLTLFGKAEKDTPNVRNK